MEIFGELAVAVARDEFAHHVDMRKAGEEARDQTHCTFTHIWCMVTYRIRIVPSLHCKRGSFMAPKYDADLLRKSGNKVAILARYLCAHLKIEFIITCSLLLLSACSQLDAQSSAPPSGNVATNACQQCFWRSIQYSQGAQLSTKCDQITCRIIECTPNAGWRDVGS